MTLSEKEYARAFNVGYMLKEHEPELLETILKGEVGNSDYLKAVASGKEQFEKENDKDRSPSWLSKNRISNLNKQDNHKEKDKDDLDRDK